MIKNWFPIVIMLSTIFYLVTMSRWRLQNNYHKIVLNENENNMLNASLPKHDDIAEEGFNVMGIGEAMVNRTSSMLSLPYKLKIIKESNINKRRKKRNKDKKLKNKRVLKRPEKKENFFVGQLRQSFTDIPKRIIMHM